MKLDYAIEILEKKLSEKNRSFQFIDGDEENTDIGQLKAAIKILKEIND